MKLLISFIPTIFPKYNHGGSTKILKDIACYFGERGDRVTIICNERKDNNKEFYLHPNVLVKPIYKFKETYPNPYFTPPFYIKNIIETLYEHSLTHDKLLIFDSDFIFSDIFPKKYPVYFSLRDFLYSEALQGAFLMRRGEVIVNSEFVKDSLLNTVGKIFPKIKGRINLIHNGVDLEKFKKVTPMRIKKYIDLKKNDFPIILFPHRPEKEKGIYESIEVLELLIKKHRFKNAKLLISRGIDENVSDEVINFYKNFENILEKKGILNNVLFHKWIPEELMPEYYSLGDVTLCIGSIVEAFSNVTLESLACKSPVVVSNVACYKSLFPNWCVYKNNFGDIEGVCESIKDIVENSNDEKMEKIRNYIKLNHDKDLMCKKYWDILHNKKYNYSNFSFLKKKTKTINNNLIFKLPPWCSTSEKGIYNDYLQKYFFNKDLNNLLSKKKYFSIKDAKKNKIDELMIKNFIKDGYLI